MKGNTFPVEIIIQNIKFKNAECNVITITNELS